MTWIPANYEESREKSVHMKLLVNHINTILFPSICDESVAEIATDILIDLFKTANIDTDNSAINR